MVRTHTDDEAIHLPETAGVGLALTGEREIAISISHFALQQLGIEAVDAHATTERLRARDDG
ncbi:hypothetical protein [Microvirga massiliensis]|uniref:hypothetical protein n=1 Tax=Microvirga massiliensis TaxID=1033741 RepID=UPI00065FAE22|nr:hypothetical protein [Microvirga massiliensis]